MSTFTLDDLRDSIVKRYESTKIDLGDGDVVELKSILKLNEKDRKAVIDAIEELNAIDNDDEEQTDETVILWSGLVVDACAKIFKLVASSPKKLTARLEHDDPTIKANLYTAVLTRWVGETQVGEAKPSPA